MLPLLSISPALRLCFSPLLNIHLQSAQQRECWVDTVTEESLLAVELRGHRVTTSEPCTMTNESERIWDSTWIRRPCWKKNKLREKPHLQRKAGNAWAGDECSCSPGHLGLFYDLVGRREAEPQIWTTGLLWERQSATQAKDGDAASLGPANSWGPLFCCCYHIITRTITLSSRRLGDTAPAVHHLLMSRRWRRKRRVWEGKQIARPACLPCNNNNNSNTLLGEARLCSTTGK